MKWKNSFNDFRPLLKCGDAVAGAFVSALVGGASAAVSESMQQSNQSRQRGWQSSENEVNRDWQTEEAQKVRDFAAQQQLQQNQFQSDLQAKQQQYNLQSMEAQNYLNSPLHQRQQLEAAGINPQVYFGSQSSFSGTSAQSGGSPQAGAPVSSPMVGSVQGINPLPYQPIGTSIGSIIGSLGSSLRDVAQAKKLGIESDWLPDMLREQVRNLKADSDLKTLLKVGQDIHNQIDNARLPYAVRQAEADLYRSLSETNLNEAKQLSENEQAKLNQALTKLQESLENLNNKEAEKLGLEMPYYVSLIRAKIGELGSQAEKNRSESALNKYWHDFYSDEHVRLALVSQTMEAALNAKKDGQIKDEQAKQIQWAAENLKKATDNYEIQMWSNILNQSLNTAFHGVGELSRYGLVKKFMDSKPSQIESGRGYYLDEGGNPRRLVIP